MANEQQESAPEPVKVELPTPTFTEASAAQPTSAADPEVLARKVAELLKPDIEKAVQSTKDRRFDRLERSIGQLAELKELGVTIPENVEQEMRIREMEARLNSAPVAGSGPQVSKFDPTAMLQEIGLDGNDADVIAEWMKPHRNEDHLRAELAKIRLTKLTAPPPNAAGAPPMQGGAPLDSGPKTDAERRAAIFGSNQDSHFFSVDKAYENGGGPVVGGRKAK